MYKDKLFVAKKNGTLNEELINDFAKKNDITIDQLQNTSSQNIIYPQIKENIYLIHDEKIIDSCYIEGDMDTKKCTIFFAKLKEEPSTRKLVSLITDYLFTSLDIEEVFVQPSSEDKKLINSLRKNGYEFYEINGECLLVKDKPNSIESEEKVVWNL